MLIKKCTIEVKKSKFISYYYSITDVNQVKNILEN